MLAQQLSTDAPSGLRDGKKGSLLHQYQEFKAAHAALVVLMRVGEMYDAFGVDAYEPAGTRDRARILKMERIAQENFLETLKVTLSARGRVIFLRA